jgi:sugar lactone lactonase YvrE
VAARGRVARYLDARRFRAARWGVAGRGETKEVDVKAGFAVVLAVALAASARAEDDVAHVHERMLAAYRAKDWPAFLEHAKKLAALEPGDVRFVYDVACAEALNGHASEAARQACVVLDRKLDLGFATDADFAAVRDTPEFRPVLERIAALAKPVGHADLAFALADAQQIPEGIAFDPASGTWFVSSVHERKIVQRAADGAVSDFVAEGQDGLWAVLGLAVDAKRRRLWACTAAVPEMKGFDESLRGRSGVFEYDLATRKLLAKHLAPSDGRPHAIGDLAISPDGDVVASDSQGSAIYRAPRGSDALDVLVPAGVFRSPQGMAFSTDGSRLYVADYGGGLSIVDTKTKARRDVAAPDSVVTLGIDGLALRGREIVVTQNGIRPHRVSRLVLDESGERITSGEILLMNDPRFSEPTLGTIVGDAFVFVANSQWGAFDDEGRLKAPAELRPPAILSVPLGAARAR